jgi:hypothetical protein
MLIIRIKMYFYVRKCRIVALFTWLHGLRGHALPLLVTSRSAPGLIPGGPMTLKKIPDHPSWGGPVTLKIGWSHEGEKISSQVVPSC